MPLPRRDWSAWARGTAGFRTSRQLPAGSDVDAAVWQALNEEHAPAVVPYTITPEDAKGPFVKIPPDMMGLDIGPKTIETYRQKFGDYIPLLRRQDVRGFINRKPIWLNRVLTVDQVRKEIGSMEQETRPLPASAG